MTEPSSASGCSPRTQNAADGFRLSAHRFWLAPTFCSEATADVTHKPSPCNFLSKKGDKLSMHYDVRFPATAQTTRSSFEPRTLNPHASLSQGRLSTGKEFDSSRKRGQPFKFNSESAS